MAGVVRVDDEETLLSLNELTFTAEGHEPEDTWIGKLHGSLADDFRLRRANGEIEDRERMITRLSRSAPVARELVGDPSGGEELDSDTSRIVRTLGSRLRTSTTQDVATRVGPRLGPSLLTKLGRRWRRLRKPVQASIDRRWGWEKGSPEPSYFVVVENLSDREVEVTGIDVSEVTGPRIEPPLPVLIQAGEPRELSLMPGGEDVAVGRVLRVTVTLAGGQKVHTQTPPDVPMRTDVLVLPEQQGAG